MHPDVILVHAVISHGFLHAWCELPESIVYDGVDNAFYPTDLYRRAVGVIVEARYTSRQAAMHCADGWAAWDEADLLARVPDVYPAVSE